MTTVDELLAVPESEVIASCAIDIGQAEGGNVSEVTDGMVSYVYGHSDVSRGQLSEDIREAAERRTAESIEVGLKLNDYWDG